MSQSWESPFVGTDSANQTLKSKLVNTLECLRTSFAGASAPTKTTPYQLWADTTNKLLKMRDATDTIWITIAPLLGNMGRSVVSYAPLAALSAKTYHGIFVAPAPFEVVRAVLVSDTTTTGSSTGVTDWTFQLRNATAAVNLLSTAQSTGAGEITADTAYVITPDQNTRLAANAVVELVVGSNGTPTAISEWTLLLEGYEVGA